MRDVLIALAPATVAGIVLFGWRALVTVLVCVATAVLSEFVFNLICKRAQTINDLSAAVTGLILALCLPAKTEIWQSIVGSVFAIIVVKCLFGGIGSNFANPAATARVFLLVAFASSVGGGSDTVFSDLVSSATPLEIIKYDNGQALPSLLNMLIGNRMGAIGETCAIALVIGLVYLLVRKVISWHIPAVYVGSVFVMALILEGFNFEMALYQVLGGGLLIGAFFMATDYVTSPINKLGKAVFAFGCAVFTIIFRYFSSLPEGVSYAILIMNILSPYIEKLTESKPLGKVGD